MTRHAALYCRISVDRSGRREGVDVQERAGRAYAATHWPDLPVVLYSDNDLSAANGGPRPDFNRLRGQLAAGTIAHLWTVEQSRLERTEVGWFQLAATLDAAGIVEVHTDRDGIVRVQDEVAGIKAVLAAGEVRKLRKRIHARLADNAAQGRPGGATVFGYLHGTTSADGEKTYIIVPEQAAAIRDAAAKVLAGWSLTSIANEFTAHGIRGARGGAITSSTIKRTLTNPAVAGKRVYQGRIVGPGNWEPILDEATWTAVRAKLSTTRMVDRAGGGTTLVTTTRPRAARRYLLTNFVRCAVCGAPLVGSLKQMRGVSPPYYHCHPNRGGRGCVGIMAVPLEQHVVHQLLVELDKPAFRHALAEDEHAGRRDKLLAGIGDVERQRDELAAEWSAGDLTTPEWKTARAGLSAQETLLRSALADVPPPVTHVDPSTIAAGWAAMTLDEQREIIGMFVQSVTIAPAVPPYGKFQPGRVTVDWVAF